MLENLKPVEMPKTYGETVYRYLKEAIITGELRSGERLQERDIAKRFNVSITPVREAFRRLFAENYLTINARKEVMIVDSSIEKIGEIFAVISNLDLLASSRSIANLTASHIQELEQMTNELKAHHDAAEIKSYMKLDLKIHEKIWQACHNEFLFQLLLDLSEKYSFYCNNVIAEADDPTSFLLVDDHIDLLSAMKSRDAAALTEILSAHWGKGVIADLTGA